MKTKRNKLKPGHYWAAVDNRGRQVAGDTGRRNVERASKGMFKIVQLPKNEKAQD